MSKYSRRVNKKNKAFKTRRAKPKYSRRRPTRPTRITRKTRSRKTLRQSIHVQPNASNFNPPVIASAPSSASSAINTDMSSINNQSVQSVISPPWSVSSPEILQSNSNNTTVQSVSPVVNNAGNNEGVIFADENDSQNGSLHMSDLNNTNATTGTTVEESDI